MSNIKKKVKSINNAKNEFIKYLKKNNAEDIDEWEGEKEPDDGWDYYRVVNAFVDEYFFVAYFQMWEGEIEIDYSNKTKTYRDLTIEEFLTKIK